MKRLLLLLFLSSCQTTIKTKNFAFHSDADSDYERIKTPEFEYERRNTNHSKLAAARRNGVATVLTTTGAAALLAP